MAYPSFVSCPLTGSVAKLHVLSATLASLSIIFHQNSGVTGIF
jgi:hypothetical protein